MLPIIVMTQIEPLFVFNRGARGCDLCRVRLVLIFGIGIFIRGILFTTI